MQRIGWCAMKVAAALVLGAFLSLAFSGFNRAEARASASPFVCPFEVSADGDQVWIGVTDSKSPYYYRTSPLYVGRQYGAPVACERFAQWFWMHRSHLAQASCGVGFYGSDPSAPDAYQYVQLASHPFHYPPSGPYQLDYLEMGFAPQGEIQARARQELDDCNRVLDFVKAYSSAH